VAVAFRNASPAPSSQGQITSPTVRTGLDHAKFFLALMDRIIDNEPVGLSVWHITSLI
jgi:hypothetical protein